MQVGCCFFSMRVKLTAWRLSCHRLALFIYFAQAFFSVTVRLKANMSIVEFFFEFI